MKEYVIFTDGDVDLPSPYEKEVSLLPQYYYFDENMIYGDEQVLSREAFFEQLRSRRAYTAGVNPDFTRRRFEEVLGAGKDVLCIAFSSGLSTTYQSAAIAASEVMSAHPGSKVLVCDSRAASLGQGLLVYLAVQEKRKGKSLEELRDFVEERKNHICHWFTVDDLNHLKRGGRVSAAAALFGTMLQMKPILHVDGEGRLIPVDKVRGRKASISALLEKMDELVDDPSVVFISHGDCEDEAVALGEAIKAKYKVDKLVINYVGPVIGNHSGPGTLALFFQGKHK